MRRAWARFKEILGYATGDRGVEARARVEEKVADPADPVTDVTDDQVVEEQRHVREELGEYQPGRGT
jgi:hypothetical protein